VPLPELLPFHGDWPAYEDEIYRVFVGEVVRSGLTFRGLKVTCQYRPPSKGKHFGFWHLISEGDTEEDRTPDLRRCERIRWVAWLIRNAEFHDGVSWWENRRGSNTHVVLWLEEEDFVVVLAKRRDYYLLRTAYCVEKSHRRRSLQRERDRFWQAQKD
jgi:hypothetical protein